MDVLLLRGGRICEIWIIGITLGASALSLVLRVLDPIVRKK